MLMKRSNSICKNQPLLPHNDQDNDETNKGHKFEFISRSGSSLSLKSLKLQKIAISSSSSKTTPPNNKNNNDDLSSNNSNKNRYLVTCFLSTVFLFTFGVWCLFNTQFFLSHSHSNQFTRVTPRTIPHIGVRASLPVYFEHSEMDALNEYLELKKIHYIYPTALQSTIADDKFIASEYFNSAALWDDSYSVYWMLTRLTSTKQHIESSRLLLSVYNSNWERVINDQFLPFRPNDNHIYGPEDPRLFSINGEIMFTFQYLDPTQIGVAKLFKIISPIRNEITNKLETIEIPTTFYMGTNRTDNIWNKCNYPGLDEKTWQKNWSPFEYKNSLYFMVTFNPLFLIHCDDLCESMCEIVYDGKYSVDSNEKNSVGVVRGGTQLIQVPNMITPNNKYDSNNNNYDSSSNANGDTEITQKKYDYLFGILHTTWWEDRDAKIAHSAKYRGHIVVIRVNLDNLNDKNDDDIIQKTNIQKNKNKNQKKNQKSTKNLSCKKNKSCKEDKSDKILSINASSKKHLIALDNAVNSIQALANDGSLSLTQIEVINDIFQKLALQQMEAKKEEKTNNKNTDSIDNNYDAVDNDDNEELEIIRVEKRKKSSLSKKKENAQYRSIRTNMSSPRENVIKSYNFDNRIIHMTRSFTMKICLDHPLLMGSDPGLDEKTCLPVQFWSLIAFPVSIVRIDTTNDRMWISWGLDDAGSVILEVEGFLSYLKSGFSAPQGFSDLNAHRPVDTFAHHMLQHSDSFFGKAHSHSDQQV